MPAQFNLPAAKRGDSFGPIEIGPITGIANLLEAEITMSFRRDKASSNPAQVLRKSEGKITSTEDSITILRFNPNTSGNLVWDIELRWVNGETITIAENDDKWEVSLDVTRPERAI